VHKKTPKIDIENLFEDDITEPDLFAEPEKTIPQKDAISKDKGSSTSTDPIQSSSTSQRRASVPSSVFKRSALLNKHIGIIKLRLGSSPSKKNPGFRSRTWLTMIQLAKNGEDMTKIVDLISMLHDGGALPSLFAEEFVRKWYIPSHLLSKLSHIDFQVVASN